MYYLFFFTFMIAWLVASQLIEENSILTALVSSLVAGLVTAGYALYRHFQNQRQTEANDAHNRTLQEARETFEELRRRTQETSRPTPDRQPTPFDFTTLTLLIQANDYHKTPRTGLIVNTKKDLRIRPILIVDVKNRKWAKQWPQNRPIELVLMNPRGRSVLKTSFTPLLKMGINKLYDPHHHLDVNPRLMHGQWHIVLLVAGRLVENVDFTVSPNAEATLQQSIGPDQEITPQAEALAKEMASKTNIDDILE